MIRRHPRTVSFQRDRIGLDKHSKIEVFETLMRYCRLRPATLRATTLRMPWELCTSTIVTWTLSMTRRKCLSVCQALYLVQEQQQAASHMQSAFWQVTNQPSVGTCFDRIYQHLRRRQGSGLYLISELRRYRRGESIPACLQRR